MKQKNNFVPKMKTIISLSFNNTSDRRTDRHSLLRNSQKRVHNKKSIYIYIYISSSYYGPNVHPPRPFCLSVCLRQFGQTDMSTIYFFSVIKIHFACALHYIFLWIRHPMTDILILSFRKHIIPLQCLTFV